MIGGPIASPLARPRPTRFVKVGLVVWLLLASTNVGLVVYRLRHTPAILLGPALNLTHEQAKDAWTWCEQISTILRTSQSALGPSEVSAGDLVSACVAGYAAGVVEGEASKAKPDL